MGALLYGARLLLVVQASQATVAGTVREADHATPLAGVVVTLTDAQRSTLTDSLGHFLLTAVPSGAHHLTVEALGYGRRTLHVLVPGDGRLDVDVDLDPAPLRLPGIAVLQSHRTVRGLDGSDDTDADRAVNSTALRHHPLSAEPDAFATLVGGGVGARPEAPVGLNVYGGASDQTTFLLDGIPVLNPYHTTFLFSAWNPDALAGVRLFASAPSFTLSDALSATVEGVTRAPGRRLGVQASASTAQMRVTLDGPIAGPDAGFVLALRAGYPGTIAPNRERSYVRGETADAIAKVEAAVLGGTLRVLGYRNEDELSLAAATAPGSPRNGFEWEGGSAGATWTRTVSAATLRLSAWSAHTAAGADWAAADPEATRMSASRHDVGVAAVVDMDAGHALARAGVRVEHVRTRFRAGPPAGGATWGAEGATPVAAGFVEHRRALPGNLGMHAGLALTLVAGDGHVAPRGRLTWSAGEAFRVHASFARTHQYAQSLRNDESIAATLFPAHLFIVAGAANAPVARSDLGALAAEWRPSAGLHIAAESWIRSFHGLVLAAPRSPHPFATEGFATGRGAARGIALDAGWGTARLGITASHAWQSVRMHADGDTHVPGYASAHRTDFGAIVFASKTTAIRAGLVAETGRRSTAASGPLEWEACNLLDQGCEFGGTPRADTAALGVIRLPAYLRLDLGARTHWHVRLAGRDTELGVFATVTNVLGRPNVLGFVTDPLAADAPIGMRPFAPLVAGIDWRF